MRALILLNMLLAYYLDLSNALPGEEVDCLCADLGTGDKSEGNVIQCPRVVGPHHMLKRHLKRAEVTSLGSLDMVDVHVKQVS